LLTEGCDGGLPAEALGTGWSILAFDAVEPLLLPLSFARTTVEVTAEDEGDVDGDVRGFGFEAGGASGAETGVGAGGWLLGGSPFGTS
jgi:hypothetical protein